MDNLLALLIFAVLIVVLSGCSSAPLSSADEDFIYQLLNNRVQQPDPIRCCGPYYRGW